MCLGCPHLRSAFPSEHLVCEGLQLLLHARKLTRSLRRLISPPNARGRPTPHGGRRSPSRFEQVLHGMWRHVRRPSGLVVDHTWRGGLQEGRQQASRRRGQAASARLRCCRLHVRLIHHLLELPIPLLQACVLALPMPDGRWPMADGRPVVRRLRRPCGRRRSKEQGGLGVAALERNTHSITDCQRAAGSEQQSRERLPPAFQ